MSNGDNKTALGQLASLRTGYTFRGKAVEPFEEGKVAVLQPKDIAEGRLGTSLAGVTEYEINHLPTHRLEPGDILIANKGVKFNTFLYTGSPANAVATSALFVITAHAGKILPAYLNWYLNQLPAKDYLAANASGSTIPSITKSVLTRMEVHVPPMVIQEQIVEFIEAAEKEQELLKSLIKKREAFNRSFIWELIGVI